MRTYLRDRRDRPARKPDLEVPDTAADAADGAPPPQEGGLLSNAGWLIASRLGIAALGWAGTLLIARHLSLAEFGRFTIIFAILGLMSVVTDMGIGRIALKRHDRFSRRRPGRVRGGLHRAADPDGGHRLRAGPAHRDRARLPDRGRARDRDRRARDRPRHPVRGPRRRLPVTDADGRRERGRRHRAGGAAGSHRRHRHRRRDGPVVHDPGGRRGAGDLVLQDPGGQEAAQDPPQPRRRPLVDDAARGRPLDGRARAGHDLLPRRLGDAVATRHLRVGRCLRRVLQVHRHRPLRRGRGDRPADDADGARLARRPGRLPRHRAQGRDAPRPRRRHGRRRPPRVRRSADLGPVRRRLRGREPTPRACWSSRSSSRSSPPWP